MSLHRDTRTSTRRDLLKAAAVAAAAGLTPAAAAHDEKPASNRRRTLRLAHLTDVHVQPELDAARGLAACLRHVQSLPIQPGLILGGGDTIMDAFEQDRTRTQLQWDLWNKVVRDECALPIEYCIGNHDIWGWNRTRSGATGQERQFGKKWAMEVMGLERPYRSFRRAGWQFLVLDSTHAHGESGYTAKLDDEQYEWLKSELGTIDAKTPVLVLSHIPILSASAFLCGRNEQSGDWRVPGSYVHIDARRIKDAFKAHGNVKLCLSGHLHQVDRVDFLGTAYVCDGAVSGAWWKGNHYECEPGYGVIDLYNDGSFEHEYVRYGWQARGPRGGG